MNRKVALSFLVVIVIVAGASLLMHKKSPVSPNSNSSASTSSSTSTSSATLSSTSMNPAFSINANDTSADHETLSVVKNAVVSLTFNVQKSGVYHGGLEFKSTSPLLDSGAIAPGQSKTIQFTATKSFSFQPYWYASNVKKDYLIQVNVTE